MINFRNNIDLFYKALEKTSQDIKKDNDNILNNIKYINLQSFIMSLVMIIFSFVLIIPGFINYKVKLIFLINFHIFFIIIIMF